MTLREKIIEYAHTRYGTEPERPWFKFPEYLVFPVSSCPTFWPSIRGHHINPPNHAKIYGLDHHLRPPC